MSNRIGCVNHQGSPSLQQRLQGTSIRPSRDRAAARFPRRAVGNMGLLPAPPDNERLSSLPSSLPWSISSVVLRSITDCSAQSFNHCAVLLQSLPAPALRPEQNLPRIGIVDSTTWRTRVTASRRAGGTWKVELGRPWALDGPDQGVKVARGRSRYCFGKCEFTALCTALWEATSAE